jgi:hypothetical protein
MQISPSFTARDWHNISFESEKDWQCAIAIFKERTEERFLRPIERIETCSYAGFAVLALDCLLIEMLQQFREGVNRTPSGKSKDYFITFLTNTSFGEYFDSRRAELFYRQIRCGILHQAELRGSSQIVNNDDDPMVVYSGDDRGLIVNRRPFHECLIKEFESYLAALADESNKDIRAGFLKKMKSICRNACEVV